MYMPKLLYKIKRHILLPIATPFLPIYHYFLSILGALIYRFPSRHIKVIAVTGTKGKSSTVEIINSILEEAGYKTALTNTIRFKIGNKSRSNMYKMSMPGRMFMQRFLRRAVNNDCQYAILEMTSQGAIQYRHLFIDFDAFVFTNLSKEHIEAHGSYENYIEAKLSIARQILNSDKENKFMVINADDTEAFRFKTIKTIPIIDYKISDLKDLVIDENGVSFKYKNKIMSSPLKGKANVQNILASIVCTESFGIDLDKIAKTLSRFSHIPGRLEKIKRGQDFEVIVDYAHTPDSLEKLYQVYDSKNKICVLGGTGGGRDNWKREAMGKIAQQYCSQIILTDEDPYDEDPNKIIDDIKVGIKDKPVHIILDRRQAIKYALNQAKKDDVVLITGKGTDPYIMGPNGMKTPWSDSQIVQQELSDLIR
jgi:UDP-N-acetylmuramoyl-L-alanyl-D-glutamate--2,6-diaminopimelate ligase